MAAGKMVLCFALGLTATAAAQPASAPQGWTPVSRTAQAITGRVTLAPDKINFQNGSSLPLASGGQMMFRPEPKGKKVMADLYRVTSPDDPALENGSKLWKGETGRISAGMEVREGRQRERPAYPGALLWEEIHSWLTRRLWALRL
jgi:hypothetical protein